MRDYTKYYTPQDVIDLMLEIAGPLHGKILEPHAGDGRIVNAIRKLRLFYNVEIDYCEITGDYSVHNTNGTFLGEDFLKTRTYNNYDFIIANPPFNDEEDIGLHFLKMFYSLGRGGTMVTILPTHFNLFTPMCGQMQLIIDLYKESIINLKNWAHSTELIILKLKR